MPEPVATTSNGGPLVTLLSPSPSKKSSKSSKKPSPSASESEKPAITLSQGAFEVDAGAQLYLSGVYPNGEGAVLHRAARRHRRVGGVPGRRERLRRDILGLCKHLGHRRHHVADGGQVAQGDLQRGAGEARLLPGRLTPRSPRACSCCGVSRQVLSC